jgi:dTDP-4-amino-4,6-dideoxygalactose transaminase
MYRRRTRRAAAAASCLRATRRSSACARTPIAASLRGADFDEKDPSTFLFPALNFNLDEISCAIGLQSLGRLAETIRRRVAFVRALGAALTERSTVCAPTPVSDDDSPFFHPLRVDRGRLSCSKRSFAEAVGPKS